MEKIEQLKYMAHQMRLRALKMAYDAGNNGAHLGGGLSAIEIFATLYGSVLKFDVNNPYFDDRDRLIVSKGHCVLAYYTALAHVGFLTEDDINQFEKNGSVLHGHASRNIDKGIEFSGGSLSMGMSFAVGVAIAAKKRKLNSHVYVIVGDGECNEGLIWEAAMSASHFKLSNLTVIVDCNRLQYDGETTKVMDMISLSEKFKSFGFNSIEVDGHDVEQLLNAMNNKSSEKPNAIIAHTVKGKGVSFMENVKEWHHSKLSLPQYEQAVSEQKNF